MVVVGETIIDVLPVTSPTPWSMLIELARHRLTLGDVERLQEIAGFNQDYLLLSGATTEVRSYIDTLELNRREGH